MKTIFVAANIIAVIVGIIYARPLGVLPIQVKQISVKPQVILPTIQPVTKSGWEQFKDVAVRVSNEYGVPPSVTIGMAAHESGYGKSYLCRTRNNCFGMGAFDSDPNKALSYATPEAGIRAYVKLIATNKRYHKAYEARNDPYAMIAEIKAAGYASDERYVAKVTGNPEFINYLSSK